MHQVIYNGTLEKTAMRDQIAKTLDDLMAQDEKVAYLDADLMASMNTGFLTEKYPDRAIDCGIQEANMIGVAAGMSTEGMKPYCHTFGVFASRRCYDQVFMSVGYAGNSVRVIGSDPGVQALYNGGTHQPFEDTALYRVLPLSAIFEPCDTVQMDWALREVKDRPGVTYIRAARKNQPAIYAPGSTFEQGKAAVLREGGDVTLLAAGMMVAEALEAAALLAKEGIHAAVADVVTIKPLDQETVCRLAKETRAVVTCENALVKGGLFGAVSEMLALHLPVPVEFVGLDERYGEVGDLAYLKQAMKLNAQEIAAKAKKAIARKA